MLAGRGLHAFVKLLQALQALEVTGDEVLGLRGADLELLGQFLGAHAVDEAEVDGLGIAALVRAHLVGRQVIDQGRRAGVDVLAVAEGFQQCRILRDMGQHAQLHLRIVGRDQQAARPGDLILTVGAGDIYRAGEKLLAGV